MGTEAKVVQVRDFKSEGERNAWLASLGARFRANDPLTRAPLYKTASGVVLRLANATRAEVLSNCVC